MYAITEAILRETAAKKGWDVIEKEDEIYGRIIAISKTDMIYHWFRSHGDDHWNCYETYSQKNGKAKRGVMHCMDVDYSVRDAAMATSVVDETVCVPDETTENPESGYVAGYEAGYEAGKEVMESLMEERIKEAVAEAIAARDAQWVAREKRTAEILFGPVNLTK